MQYASTEDGYSKSTLFLAKDEHINKVTTWDGNKLEALVLSTNKGQNFQVGSSKPTGTQKVKELSEGWEPYAMYGCYFKGFPSPVIYGLGFYLKDKTKMSFVSWDNNKGSNEASHLHFDPLSSPEFKDSFLNIRSIGFYTSKPTGSFQTLSETSLTETIVGLRLMFQLKNLEISTQEFHFMGMEKECSKEP